jgi:hypothetical protein
MNLSPRPLAVCFALFALAACAQTAAATDPDSLKLVAMSEQARQIGEHQIPIIVLRQADTDLSSTTFLFTDKAGTIEIDITAPSPDAPPDRWTAIVLSVSPLLGRPVTDVNLNELRVGPGRVARAMTSQWASCKVRGLIVYRDESDNDLVWTAFCDTPQGTVTGTMSNRTGTFQASNAPPARMPVTATPER